MHRRPMGGDHVKALQLSLADPPYTTRTDSGKVSFSPPNIHAGLVRASSRFSLPCSPSLTRLPADLHAVQNASFDVVCKALNAIKEADIAPAVGALTLDECDVLMKYLYRGLGPAGKKNETYHVLLKWHPAVLKRAGHASITRTISEVNRAL